MSMRITPGELSATIAKVEKINGRAAKKGFTGRLQIKAEKVIVETKNDLGFKVNEEWYDVTIEGEAPKYNGWELAAVLSWDAESGLIVRTAPGVDKVNRDGLKEGYCDHCKTKRHRNETYLVRNGKLQKQVGSTCIKDFLGWRGNIVFISADDIANDIDDFLGGGGYYESRWEVSTILAVAWAAIQVDGFKPASSFGGTTKDLVFRILDPRSKWDRQEAEKFQPYIDKSYAQAKVIREWVLSDAFSGDNEYVRNLKAVANAETASPRNIGLLVSAPQTWAKAQERDLVRRKEKAEIVNEWVGKVKDRIELSVTIKSIRFIDGEWGTTTLYTLESEDHHVFKWFSSSGALGTDTSDKVYRIKGTIKKHDEYNGLMSTVLTRVSVIS